MPPPLTLTRRGRWVAYLAVAVYAGLTIAATVAFVADGLTGGPASHVLVGAALPLIAASIPVVAADRTWRTPTPEETR